MKSVDHVILGKDVLMESVVLSREYAHYQEKWKFLMGMRTGVLLTRVVLWMDIVVLPVVKNDVKG